ncbi:hypothetical protein [Streptomyces hoynatensis]|uniref:Uncharacterized protein n=1 Tax=Streptomyces hoynatensis TaxID=1141874 RepID=A0A3A9YPY9_9ACTN|nr:hypothetical protein [Streptomyces hoynatensis]RKN37287.1 hypothetical protein D7294_28375 [Streptomyces hoynatensis]
MSEESADWLLTVEGRITMGHYDCQVLEEVRGTHLQAMEALWRHVHLYNPPRPLQARRRWIYRDADGYLARYLGSAGGHYVYTFLVRRLVWDSERDG